MKKTFLFWILLSLLLTACGKTTVSGTDSEPLTVVATTGIVADVVSNVAGENIVLQILLPAGTDPHSFEPTPQDLAKAANADIIFANGAGLENFIDHLLENADSKNKVVEVSQGIELREHPRHPSEHDEHEKHGHGNEHENGDPHTWVDPNNVMIWVKNIEAALCEADPANASVYSANAAAYLAQLQETDAWIREQIAQIPAENRKIVTDHAISGYYVDEYGLEMSGVIIPGYSSLSQPSAQDLAAIEDIIRQTGVKAIFVGNTVNSSVAERIAEDTGVSLVYIYTGSLSAADGDAPTYLAYLRYNTNAFLHALK